MFNVLKNYNLKFISLVRHDLEKYFKQVLATQPDTYHYEEEKSRKEIRKIKKETKKTKKDITQTQKTTKKSKKLKGGENV